MEYNTKYSKEFKLNCVLRYLNGEYIETPPNTKRHTFTNKIGEWVRLYKLHG
jgi:transposase-like protein